MELVIRTRMHPRNKWILVPVDVAKAIMLWMVLDTGAPFSSISEDTRDDLLRMERLHPLRGGWYELRGPQIEGQFVSSVPVRLSQRVTQVGADGVLGLDFLQQFTDVHFHTPSLTLTLTSP